MVDVAQEKPQLLNGAPDDNSLDWETLRAQSIQPHGFGLERVRIWPKLLHVDDEALQKRSLAKEKSAVAFDDEEASEGKNSEQVTPHADERQIGLDTDRSFVLYPDTDNREKLQTGLNRLIVSLFRRRPRLHYFQGYHDIVSVLFLTLPEELHLLVTEQMSLHRVRDSMGTTLEPVVGLLRILKRILHLADEKFAAVLEQAASLPYYALSNLLTLFSHDIPTLALIQHIFDYLLSRPPIAVVYLAAALTLTRREEVRVLEEEGEEGMMHSLLTSLPDLYEEGEDSITPMVVPTTPAAASPSEPKIEEKEPFIPPGDEDATRAETPLTLKPEPNESNDAAANVVVEAPSAEDLVLEQSETPSLTGDPEAEVHEATSSTELKAEEDGTPPSGEKASLDTSELTFSEKGPLRRSPSPEPRLHRPRVSLTALLARADALYAQYPPTHPGVAVSSVLGPQSVMLTWAERRTELPSDDDAERMVLNPDLIVLPHIESDDDVASDGDSYRAPGSGRKSHKSEKERRRRKLRKPRRLTDMVVQRKTMVAGAVLVLGVAMAVYGFNTGLPGAGGGHHRSGFGREFRKVGRFLGGAIVGAGERVFEGIHQVLQ